MSGVWNSDGSAALTQTQYGFRWGAAVVTRIMDHPQYGTVIRVGSDDWPGFEIRVTPQGRKITVTCLVTGKQIAP